MRHRSLCATFAQSGIVMVTASTAVVGAGPCGPGERKEVPPVTRILEALVAA